MPDEIGRHRSDPLCGSADHDAIGIDLFGGAPELAGRIAVSDEDAAGREPEKVVSAGGTIAEFRLVLPPPSGDVFGRFGEHVSVGNGRSDPDTDKAGAVAASQADRVSSGMARRLRALAVQLRDVQSDDDGAWGVRAGVDEGVHVLRHGTSMTQALRRVSGVSHRG